MNTIVAIVLIVMLGIALVFTIASLCNLADLLGKTNMELMKLKTMFKTAYAISDDTTKKVLDEIDDEK